MPHCDRRLIVQQRPVAVFGAQQIAHLFAPGRVAQGDEAARGVADDALIEPGLQLRIAVAQALDGASEVAAGVRQPVDFSVGRLGVDQGRDLLRLDFCAAGAGIDLDVAAGAQQQRGGAGSQ